MRKKREMIQTLLLGKNCIVEGRVKIVVVLSYLGKNGSDTVSIR